MMTTQAEIQPKKWCIVYQPGAHKVCARLVLRLIYVPASVSLFIRNYHVYQIMSLCHCSHEHSQLTVEATGSLQPHYAKVHVPQSSLVLRYLDGEKVVGSDDNSVWVSSGSKLETRLPSQHLSWKLCVICSMAVLTCC